MYVSVVLLMILVSKIRVSSPILGDMSRPVVQAHLVEGHTDHRRPRYVRIMLVDIPDMTCTYIIISTKYIFRAYNRLES